jgi:hypothetical protein
MWAGFREERRLALGAGLVIVEEKNAFIGYSMEE